MRYFILKIFILIFLLSPSLSYADPNLEVIAQLLLIRKTLIELHQNKDYLSSSKKIESDPKSLQIVFNIYNFLSLKKKLIDISDFKKKYDIEKYDYATSTGPWIGEYWKRLGDFDKEKLERKSEGWISQFINWTKSDSACSKRIEFEQMLDYLKSELLIMSEKKIILEDEKQIIFSHFPSLKNKSKIFYENVTKTLNFIDNRIINDMKSLYIKGYTYEEIERIIKSHLDF